MSYGHVYVASVAMQARSRQTRQAAARSRELPGAVARDRAQPLHRPRLRPGPLARPAAPGHRQRCVAPLPLRPPTDRRAVNRRWSSTPTRPRCRCASTWNKRPGSGWSRCATPSASPSSCAAEHAVRDRHALYEQLAEIRPPVQRSPPMADLTTDLARPRTAQPAHRRRLAAGRRRHRRGYAISSSAGAGAVVLRSVFEEQIVAEQLAVHRFIDSRDRQRRRSPVVPARVAHVSASAPTLRCAHLDAAARRGRRAGRRVAQRGHPRRVDRPSPCQMQTAGADAIELNLYDLATDLDETSADIEDRQLEVVVRGRRPPSIPVTVKLSPFYSAPAELRPAARTRRRAPAWPCSTGSTSPTSTPTPSTSTATSICPPPPSSRCALHALALLHARSACRSPPPVASTAARRGQGDPVRRDPSSRSCRRSSTRGPAYLTVNRDPRRVARDMEYRDDDEARGVMARDSAPTPTPGSA